jgi:hypothetical protein
MRSSLFIFIILPVQAFCQWTGIPDDQDITPRADLASFDLNTTDKATLRQMSSLSDEQINELLAYRESLGPFLSPYELQALKTFQLHDIKQLLTSFYLADNGSIIKSVQSRNFVMVRFKFEPHERMGFKNSKDKTHFRGDRSYLMLRSQYQSEAWEVAFTAEKDAGEELSAPFIKGKRGFDHYAGFIRWNNLNGLRITLGNYRVHTGQGLISGAGFSLGKGSDPIVALRSPKAGILGYRGLGEGIALTGISLEVNKPNYSSGLFISQRKKDARRNEEGSSSYIHGFQESGYHRTTTELEGRRSVIIKTGGIYINKRISPSLQAGATYRIDAFSLPLRRQQEWYDQKSWEGNLLQNLGFSVEYQRNGLFSWVEAAASDFNKLALQAGILLHPGRNWATSLLLRNYQPGYMAMDAQAFGEKSGIPQNEQGIFWGISVTPKKRWKISASLDVFRFPWLTFSSSSPGIGSEVMMHTSFRLSNMDFSINYRYEGKPDDLPSGEKDIRTPRERVIHQGDIFLKKPLTHDLEWRFRMRYKRVTHAGSTIYGMGGYQEVIFSQPRWTLSYRLTLFDSKQYESRIYLFERDVWGSFALQALNGQGVRQYLLLRYRMSKKTDFWIRYARTRLIDAREGSSIDDIPGHVRSLLSLQFKIKL